MPMAPVPSVALTPVAYFPTGYILENLAVRADGSVLVTTVQHKELWHVAGPEPRADVPPVLVATFEGYSMGVVEAEPDVFIIGVSDQEGSTRESHLARVDFNGWTPGEPVKPEIILTFDKQAQWLNGSCMLGPGVLLEADCYAGLIWRVDLAEGAHSASARVWLAHDTMAFDPNSVVTAPPPQPGINGLRYGPRTGHVYYTSGAQEVFMRVPVDQATLEPAGPPEFVAAVDMQDDFCVDEDAGFAYVSRHRANSIDRVPLTPTHGMEVMHIVDNPTDRVMVGPTSLAWRNHDGDYGQVFYVLTDGGTVNSPDGIVRKAAMLRGELATQHGLSVNARAQPNK
jgi:hypothetical protein